MMHAAIKLPITEGDNLSICYVGSHQIDEGELWNDHLFWMLESACDVTITPVEIYQAIADDKALAWVILDGDEPIAAAVTRQHERHGRKWLDVLALGGKDWDRWAPMLHVELTRHAAAIGCDSVVAHVRRGLVRLMRALGYAEKQVHVEFRIDG